MKAEIRPAERAAHCRLCDGDIKRGDRMVTWWSHWNRGMYIHLHLQCASDMGYMAERELNGSQPQT